MMFICERNKVQVDVQKIDEFMRRIFSDSEDYQMSKTSIERQYRRISVNYKDDEIEGLNRSNKDVQSVGML
jgi:hypothetical protein